MPYKLKSSKASMIAKHMISSEKMSPAVVNSEGERDRGQRGREGGKR